MRVNKNERTVFFDVDDTLIVHHTLDKAGRLVNVLDPLSGEYLSFREHTSMVRLLREESHRKSHIVVWSRGGWEWARNVVLTLGIEYMVHEVMTKPMVYFDDKDITEWLPYRVYFEPGTDYKNT
jgi:hypothetical protein